MNIIVIIYHHKQLILSIKIQLFQMLISNFGLNSYVINVHVESLTGWWFQPSEKYERQLG